MANDAVALDVAFLDKTSIINIISCVTVNLYVSMF